MGTKDDKSATAMNVNLNTIKDLDRKSLEVKE
jgi:hypothetical protein